MAAPSLISGFPKTTQGISYSGTTVESPSFSTSSDSVLLVAVLSFIEDVGTAGTLTCTGHGLTWTSRVTRTANSCRVAIWTAWASSTLSSAAVTVTAANSGTMGLPALSVYGYTGSQSTLGSSSESAAQTTSISCSANSQVVFGVGAYDTASLGAATNCTSDVSRGDTDNESYWVATLNGHRTNATTAGSHTVGASGSSGAAVVAALEILEGASPTTVNADGIAVSVAIGAASANAHTISDAAGIAVSVAMGAASAQLDLILGAAGIAVSVAMGAVTVEAPGPTTVEAEGISVSVAMGAAQTLAPAPLDADGIAVSVAMGSTSVVIPAPVTVEADGISVQVAMGAADANSYLPFESAQAAVRMAPVDVWCHKYFDNFNRANGALTSPWKKHSLGTIANIVSNQLNQTPNGYGSGIYQATISANQYSQLQVTYGTPQNLKLYVRQQVLSSYGYSASFLDDGNGGYYAIINKTAAVGGGNIGTSGSFDPGSVYRFAIASQDAASPALLSLYVDDVLVYSLWDTQYVLDTGWPGFQIGVGGGYTTRGDNWAAGELPAPNTPCTAGFPGKALAISGSVGEPVPCTAGFPGKALTISGSVGEPIACTTAMPAKALAISGHANASVSRVKQTAVYPSWTAYGGTDSYTALSKGQICTGGEASIGRRVGLGSDGVAGDRVFLHVPAANLIRADTPSNPVYAAKLFVTVRSCMNWDRLATGAAATPSGTMFRVRGVTSGTGMGATLATVTGGEATITAKPIWLSGQLWFDGSVVGNPVEEFELDVTALYNAASQAGADLDLCLECVLGNTKWVAELVGDDPALPWAKPRIEVQRWGNLSISVGNTDTCTPTVTVTPATGTLTGISWGYDEYPTAPGGCFRYLPSGEGLGTSSPYRLPMLESSARVHVAIEVDYGASGAQLFRRTWKTPRVFAPLVESAVSAPKTGWLDVRGPCLTQSAGACDAWHLLVKRDVPAWSAGTPYSVGDVVRWMDDIYYATTSATSGQTSPVADAFWRVGTNKVDGARWTLFRATNHQDSFAFKAHVGSFDSTNVDTVDPLPYPSIDEWVTVNGIDYGAEPFTGLELEADDVSEPWYDVTTGCLHFLSTLNGATGHEVRLNTVWFTTGGEIWWGINNWSAGIHHVQSPIIYSAASQPNLQATGAVTRAIDWRHCVDHDPYAPVLAAFIADGVLRCYSNGTQPRSQGFAPSGGWTLEVSGTPDNVADVRFVHLLTHAGSHRTVLAASGTGTGYINSRADDTISWTNGGGYTRTSGSWAQNALQLTHSRVWATETLPERSKSHGESHIPDNHSVALAVQMQDDTVRFYRPDLVIASGGQPALAPEADFDTSSTWNRHARCVTKWPPRTSYSTWTLGSNGGMVAWRYSSTALIAHRAQDYLRVSGEREAAMAAAITGLHVPRDMLLEGQRVPVVTAHADGYRVATVTVGVDYSRMHLPTGDLRARFTSGRLTTASFVQLSSNQRLPSDITQLPGHNTFATGWPFDLSQGGGYISNPNGIMNESGWNYLVITGCAGERIRLVVHDTPNFGGKWRAGTLVPATDDQTYQAEALGGTTWQATRFSTWWWTNDPPTTSPRRWKRVIDGMDYVLDGETQGGCYVITMLSQGNTLWLAHDYVSDIDTWQGDVTNWLANNASGYVRWVNASGELLTGVGASATTPLSQTVTMP